MILRPSGHVLRRTFRGSRQGGGFRSSITWITEIRNVLRQNSEEVILVWTQPVNSNLLLNTSTKK